MSPEYRDVLSTSLAVNKNNLTMPSISKLQRIIEAAWQAGFDRMGCEQLGGKLLNTRQRESLYCTSLLSPLIFLSFYPLASF